MCPTIQIGPWSLPSYTVLLDLGLVAGLILFYRRMAGEASARRAARWLDLMLVVMVAAVIGARIGYVLAHGPYYEQHPDQVLCFWRGGLSWHGALVGALVGTAVAAGVFRLPFVMAADGLALAAPVVGAAGWLGCLSAGCAFGREVPRPHWLAADLPDLFGIWALRYNVQLLGSGWSVLVAATLWSLRNWLPKGGAVGLFLALYGLGLGFVDALRGDVAPLWSGRRLDVVLDWACLVCGLAITGVATLRRRQG